MTIGPLRTFIVPLFLLLCLAIGGSGQGAWFNAALQLIAIAILAWALLSRRDGEWSASTRHLLWLAGLTVLLVALQLVPLPPAIWTTLPGREVVVRGYAMLGLEPGWAPLSLQPYATVATAQALLPPLAVLVAMAQPRAFSERRLVVALLIGASFSMLLGVLQTMSGEGRFYLFPIYNVGKATGAFANANHLAALLLVTLPFVAALCSDFRSGAKPAARGGIAAGGVMIAAVLGVGIVLAESMAIVLLALPVAIASGLILWPPSATGMRKLMLGIAGLAVVLVAAGGLLARDLAGDAGATSLSSRTQMWETSTDSLREQFPVGSGLGTFQAVYRLQEAGIAVDRTYANHAHNDFLEIGVEAGLPGLALVAAFLLWWGLAAKRCWSLRSSSAYQRAAVVATAALLAHSLVDFSLRTAALAAVFTMSLGLMALAPTRRSETRPGDLRPARHLRL